MPDSKALYNALDMVPAQVHITLQWDWVASLWIVTLDGRGGGCEDRIISVSNMNFPDDCLDGLILFAVQAYKRKFT